MPERYTDAPAGRRVWLIGEANPYGSDPRFALYPEPPASAGGRLCRLVLGSTRREYLARYERRNLLDGNRWSAPRARESARAIHAESAGAPLVLLGARVAAAFGLPFEPFAAHALCSFDVCGISPPAPRYLVLPHPSGRCRAWNEPGAFDRAGLAVQRMERGS